MRNRNKKSRGRTVLNQHLKDLKTEKNYSNEDSPHWEWTFEHGHQTPDGDFEEHNRANPDNLPEQDDDFNERQAAQRDLIQSVKAGLTVREKQVFDLLEAGYNQVEIALSLGIRKQAVCMTIRRIRIKFIRAEVD